MASASPKLPVWGTVYHYFRTWNTAVVWARLRLIFYKRMRKHAGRSACPSVVIMDSQSVKTTERGGVRGFALRGTLHMPDTGLMPTSA